MNDPENFLTRWSRRKRDATSAGAADSPPGDEGKGVASDAPAGSAAGAAAAPARGENSGTIEPPFDLSQLPPIESITAESDIRAFLAPGVPAELRLAALRRAWVADPKVRDFVGLNDYDFDFHTPGAIPGFGSLEMTDELRREVLRIVSSGLPEADAGAPAPPAASSPAAESAQPMVATAEIDASQTSPAPSGDEAAASRDHPSRAQDELISAKATTHRNKDSAAPQQEQSHSENLPTLARRGHGRALPR